MTDTPVLAIERLSLSYAGAGQRRQVVHDVSFSVGAGEIVALVGESGSGKSTTAHAIIGLLPDGGQIDHGAIRLNGTDISRWSPRRFQAIRGAQMSLVPQDPGSSLNPVKTIGEQVGEIFRINGHRFGRSTTARVIDLLEHVGLSQPQLRMRQYPHELSGGMKQRVLIAIAIALRPSLIIADEPTSALDVTVQQRILDLIDTLRREHGTAVLLVTHDLGVAADRASRLVVLQHGRIQEQGETTAILAAPCSPYTRQLLADAPSLNVRPAPLPRMTGNADAAGGNTASDVIVVEDLCQEFQIGGWRQPLFRAVDGVSFRVGRGSTHAIVGESGSGKTTTVRAIVGFQKPSAGRILIDGTDMTTLKGEALRQFRKTIQLVYQNPFSSLDPRQSIFDIVAEPLLNFAPVDKATRTRKVAAMLECVGLPATVLERRPAALSGGQRQRVALARALVLDPKILVLDEAVSALDVTVQAQILALLRDLQADLGLTYLFISHDLSVVRAISDTVSVFQNGRQVETGPVERIFQHPANDYTRELIAAIPGQRRHHLAA